MLPRLHHRRDKKQHLLIVLQNAPYVWFVTIIAGYESVCNILTINSLSRDGFLSVLGFADGAQSFAPNVTARLWAEGSYT